jgi:WhiB family redox-sensing transcriptional regulator
VITLREFQFEQDKYDSLPCHETPDAFFATEGPNDSHLAAMAKKLCEECPLQEMCLQYALDNREIHGIWGGLTQGARRLLIRSQGRGRGRPRAIHAL